MKWRKLGRIFDPAGHALPDGCTEFAQSPQALVLTDRVRIFFSTRRRDASGKYVSHVAYADFDKSLERLLDVARHTVIEPGGLGCFDEHGIFPMSPTRVGDRIFGYTTGWNRKVSVSADSSIGLAVSADEGRTFHRIGPGPVVTSSLHEPFLVADAFVATHEGAFHMWYIHGTKWSAAREGALPDRVYKIAHATSQDGIAWRKEGRPIVGDVLGDHECQALPTVIRIAGRYHMYFCYRAQYGFRDDAARAYRLGYAFSDDLVQWSRDDASAGIDVSSDGWDRDMQCYPNVFESEGRVYLLYNGNEFGRHGFGAAVLVT